MLPHNITRLLAFPVTSFSRRTKMQAPQPTAAMQWSVGWNGVTLCLGSPWRFHCRGFLPKSLVGTPIIASFQMGNLNDKNITWEVGRDVKKGGGARKKWGLLWFSFWFSKGFAGRIVRKNSQLWKTTSWRLLMIVANHSFGCYNTGFVPYKTTNDLCWWITKLKFNHYVIRILEGSARFT